MLSHQVNEGIIQGVVFKLLDEKKDKRGSFTEIFQHYWELPIEPVQWSMVKSAPKTFRGLHLHKRHDEYFSLISGHCLVGLKDMRPSSSTYGNTMLFELFEQSPAMVAFPIGLLHGWYFFEPSIHVQAVSESYVDYHADDNWGCYWNDPELGIDWGIPEEDVVLSGRATSFPPLKTLIKQLHETTW